MMNSIMSFFEWLQRNLAEISTGAAIAIAFSFALLSIRARGRRALENHPHRRTLKGIVAGLMANTTWLFAIAVGLNIVAMYAPLNESVELFIRRLLVLVAPFQVAVWLRELIMGLIRAKTATENGSDDLRNAMSVISVIVNASLFTFATVLALDNLGINVSALMAGLGIGGIAIGLAAKGVFSDLFAALSILIDKPFKRGDSIIYDDTEAVVESIGMMSTRLRSKFGQQIIISNEKLLEKEIVNTADAINERDVVRFSLPFDTPAAKLRDIPTWMEEELEKIDKMKLHRAAIRDIVDNDIRYEVIFWVQSGSGGEVARKKSEFIIAMLDRLDREGVRLRNPARVDVVEFTAERKSADSDRRR